jgi:hypothetical protein
MLLIKKCIINIELWSRDFFSKKCFVEARPVKQGRISLLNPEHYPHSTPKHLNVVLRPRNGALSTAKVQKDD